MGENYREVFRSSMSFPIVRRFRRRHRWCPSAGAHEKLEFRKFHRFHALFQLWGCVRERRARTAEPGRSRRRDGEGPESAPCRIPAGRFVALRLPRKDLKGFHAAGSSRLPRRTVEFFSFETAEPDKGSAESGDGLPDRAP